MNNELTAEDIDVILESLKYSMRTIADYQGHPTPDFKQNKLDRIQAALAKMRSLRGDARR